MKHLRSSKEISDQMTNLLNKINSFHHLLSTEEGQTYANGLLECDSKLSTRTLEQLKDFDILKDIKSIDDTTKKLETFLNAAGFYDFILEKSQTIKNNVDLKRVFSFN